MESKAAERASNAIGLLGGPSKVAIGLSVSVYRVRKWAVNGIPPRWVLPVAKLAGVSPSEIDPQLYPPELLKVGTGGSEVNTNGQDGSAS